MLLNSLHRGAVYAALACLTGCQTLTIQPHPAPSQHRHCASAEPAAPVDTIEVGGLVRFPGLIPVEDESLELSQVLIRAGSVDPSVRGNAPFRLFVVLRIIVDGEAVTTYFPLPLVEQGLAGAVRVPANSRVSVLDRQETGVDPIYTRRERILTLSTHDATIALRGFRIGATTTTVGQLLTAANPENAQQRFSPGALRGAAILSQQRYPQSNPNAGVAVITRRSLDGLGVERFVLAMDEPPAIAIVPSASQPQTTVEAPERPEPASTPTNRQPEPERPPATLASNRPAPSGRAGGIIPRSVAEELGVVPELPRVTVASQATMPRNQGTADSTPQESSLLYVDRVDLIHGDQVDFVPLPLIPEVLTGVVTSRTKERMAQRRRTFEKMCQERDAAQKGRDERQGDTTLGQYTEPITRVGRNIGESTRRVFGLLMQ